MVTDPDAMWRPGYEGPPPQRTEPASFETSRERFGSVALDDRPHPARDGARATSPPRPVQPRGTVIPVRFDEPAEESEASEAAELRPAGPGRRRLATLIAVTAVAALVVAGVVVLGADDAVEAPGVAAVVRRVAPGSGDPAADDDGGPAGGPAEPGAAGRVALPVADAETLAARADPRRLPDTATPLWSVELSSGGSSPNNTPIALTARDHVEVVDSRFVAVIHGPGVLERASLELFDAADGALLWSRDLPAFPDTFAMMGVVDDVLLVQSSLADVRVRAYDLADGSERWTRAEGVGRFDVLGEAGTFEILTGTPLIARRPVVDDKPTLLLDAATGDEVGRLDGTVVGTDRLGGWHVDQGRRMVEYPLDDGFRAARVVDDTPSWPTERGAVVDGRLVQPDGGEIVVSRQEVVGITLAVVDSDTHGVGAPDVVSAVTAMSGPTMLLTGAGDTIGAELIGNVVRPYWRRPGAVQSTHPTLRGDLVLLATRGGAQQELLDGRTGSVVFALSITPGAFDALEVVGNGIVARRASPIGERIAALDLDGDERWSLLGGEPLAVGDGLVARVTDRDDGRRLTLYGDV